MNIDVTALKAVVGEKGIPADTVIQAIESALVTAYRHADGAAKHVRVHVDRKSGEVAVLAGRDAGLRGLHHGHPRAAGRSQGGHGGRDDGLADARPGAGHDEHAHPADPRGVRCRRTGRTRQN